MPCISYFGANDTDQMVVGGPRLTRDNRGHLHLDASGHIHSTLSTSGAGGGQVNFPKGWSEKLAGSPLRHFLDVIGTALEVAVDPRIGRPLSRRLLDAIHWFGEAVRETSDAAKIVKYTIGLERMVMTSEHDDISTVVSDRCAAFLWIGDDRKTLRQWKTDITSLYDLRSRLVHGDMSPLAPEIAESLHLAADAARMTILSVLNHFGHAGMQAEDVSTRQLATWFDRIVDISKRQFAEHSGELAEVPHGDTVVPSSSSVLPAHISSSE